MEAWQIDTVGLSTLESIMLHWALLVLSNAGGCNVFSDGGGNGIGKRPV